MSSFVYQQGGSGGGGGASASIFVTGLTEESSVSAETTAVRKKPLVIDGYTTLEYIESLGAQYINTGVVGKSGIEVSADIMWVTITGDESAIGARAGERRIYPIDLDGGKWNIGYGTNYTTSVTASAGVKYSVYSKLYKGSQILKVDGTTVGSWTSTGDYNTGLNLWVPTTNGDNELLQPGHVRIYTMSISMDGVLVRDYLAVKRNSDGAIGMYDLVTQTFFGNSGTGTFIAGEEITRYIEEPYGVLLEGKWSERKVPNPESLVPDGYTQLSYIESTGTQYLNSKYTLTSNITEIGATFFGDLGVNTSIYGSEQASTTPKYSSVLYRSTDTMQYYIGGAGSLAPQAALANNWNTSVARTQSATQGVVTFNGANTNFTYTNGTQKKLPIFIFANNIDGNAEQVCTVKLKRFYIKDNNTLVRDMYPAKRNSDGVIGLYDTVNKVFYTNAGTGTFLAGEEIPKEIDGSGFLVAPIRNLGMWTVTATDGKYTKTQDVLVDVVTQYEIEMSYRTYLYRAGDECIGLTGGWSAYAYAASYDLSTTEGYRAGAPTLVKNADSMTATQATNAYSGTVFPANTIDLTPYSTLCWEGYQSGVDFGGGHLRIAATKGNNFSMVSNKDVKIGTNDRTVVSVDISDINGKYYPVLSVRRANSDASAVSTITENIWLE